MRIRLTTARAGIGLTNFDGEIVELDAREAGRLLATGQAEPIADEPTDHFLGNHRGKPKPRKGKDD